MISAQERLGPYTDPVTGCLLTYNGEIYNFRELASSWGITLGARDTDAHLLLRGYLKLGPQVITQLEGMFAFALYDPRTQTTLLGRDPLGEKPLYYATDTGGLRFASETKAFPAADRAQTQDLSAWLALENLLGADTPYRHIHLLEPGHFGVHHLGASSVEVRRYWDLPGQAPPALNPAQRFEELLEQATCATRPNRPFALMLSGGLDSAVLAHSMRPDLLVTVRYPGIPQLDEQENAATVARQLGSDLVTLEPSPADFIEVVDPMMHALDYPVGNASLFSEHLLYRKVHELGVDVVIGGIGPDEFLLGYARHSIFLDGPGATADPALQAYSATSSRFAANTAGKSAMAERYLQLLLRGPDVEPKARITLHEAFHNTRDAGQALTRADLKTAFPALLLSSDKLSSAFGLERRSPYLAKQLVEFCYSLSVRHKRSGAIGTKSLLRDYARKIGVPREIWDDRQKMGFASPLGTWLGDELSEWADQRLRWLLHEPSTPYVLRMFAASARRIEADNFSRTRIQAVLMATWWRQHLEQESPHPHVIAERVA